jgi:dTDP-4-dehydrorhamnose reductase
MKIMSMQHTPSLTKQVFITGAAGQLGYELQRFIPTGYTVMALDVDHLDITHIDAVELFFSQHPADIIINAAAYTAVDKAESDSQLAWQVNHIGAENLAKVAKKYAIQLIQISTDFIFNGQQSHPYLETEYVSTSESVYGKSKHAGEQAVLQYAPQHSLIIRTSWLYSAHGHNFVKSMLNLMQSRDTLGIVADQIGTPTWANTLATVIWQLITTPTPASQQIYHCADNGVASWYDFAMAIQQLAKQQGLLDNVIPIKAIRTQDYPTPAARPHYSVMDKTQTESHLGITLPHWQRSLAHMLKELN